MNFPRSHDSRDSIPPPAWDYRASQDSIPLPLMDRGSPIPDPSWPISRDSIPSPTLLSPLPTSQVEEKDGINPDVTFYKNSLLQSKISSSSMIHAADKNLSQMQNNSIGSNNVDNIINDGSYYDNNNYNNYYNGINYDDVKDEEHEEILLKNLSQEKNDVLKNQRINDENDKESGNSNDDSSNSSSKSRDSSSQDNNFGDNIVMNLSSSTSSTSASSFSIYGSLLRKF